MLGVHKGHLPETVVAFLLVVAGDTGGHGIGHDGGQIGVFGIAFVDTAGQRIGAHVGQRRGNHLVGVGKVAAFLAQ
jgi:hypothetical protein